MKRNGRIMMNLLVALGVSQFAIGCGKQDINTEKVTEQEIIIEATDRQAEEIETETESEEPVLFRVAIISGSGTYVPDVPSTDAKDGFFGLQGEQYDVYEVCENEKEGTTYYKIKVDGKTRYLDADAVQVLSDKVLFRIKVTDSRGTYLIGKPEEEEYGDAILVEQGTEWDVYSEHTSQEGNIYYEVRIDGRPYYAYANQVQKIEEN